MSLEIPSRWEEGHADPQLSSEAVLNGARAVAATALSRLASYDTELCYYRYESYKGVFTEKIRGRFFDRQPVDSGWFLSRGIQPGPAHRQRRLSIDNDQVKGLLLTLGGDVVRLPGLLVHKDEIVSLAANLTAFGPQDLEACERWLEPQAGTNREVVEDSLVKFVGQRLLAEAPYHSAA